MEQKTDRKRSHVEPKFKNLSILSSLFVLSHIGDDGHDYYYVVVL